MAGLKNLLPGGKFGSITRIARLKRHIRMRTAVKRKSNAFQEKLSGYGPRGTLSRNKKQLATTLKSVKKWNADGIGRARNKLRRA